MRSRMMLLILSLPLLSSCATTGSVDSFCQVYTKVHLKGDGKIVASEGVKRRLLANELLYREQCPQGT